MWVFGGGSGQGVDPELGAESAGRLSGFSLDSIPFIPKRQSVENDSWIRDIQGELSLGWKKACLRFCDGFFSQTFTRD